MATDSAPLDMYETMVRLKPRSEWRAGLSYDDLVAEMDAATRILSSRSSTRSGEAGNFTAHPILPDPPDGRLRPELEIVTKC